MFYDQLSQCKGLAAGYKGPVFKDRRRTTFTQGGTDQWIEQQQLG